jgi:hypothetical protein
MCSNDWRRSRARDDRGRTILVRWIVWEQAQRSGSCSCRAWGWWEFGSLGEWGSRIKRGAAELPATKGYIGC